MQEIHFQQSIPLKYKIKIVFWKLNRSFEAKITLNKKSGNVIKKILGPKMITLSCFYIMNEATDKIKKDRFYMIEKIEIKIFLQAFKLLSRNSVELCWRVLKNLVLVIFSRRGKTRVQRFSAIKMLEGVEERGRGGD